MKVALNTDTIAALNAFIERVRKTRLDAGSSRSVATNQILLEFTNSATSAQIESITARLVSPGKRRSGLLKRIADLSSGADPESLQALEKTLQKLQQSRKSEPKTATDSLNS